MNWYQNKVLCTMHTFFFKITKMNIVHYYIDYCQLHKGTNPRLKALTLAIVSSCNEYHIDIIIFYTLTFTHFWSINWNGKFPTLKP